MVGRLRHGLVGRMQGRRPVMRPRLQVLFAGATGWLSGS